LLERASRVIPGASQTISKGPSQWVQGVAPVFAARAEGPYLWDVEGRRYYDLPLALGPMILGHADPRVREAIERQLVDGITYTLPHRLEVELAETIVAVVPGAEMVRFGKTGSDATAAAVRAARAITGRDRVAFCGYHGWQDWHIGATSQRLGVPEAVRALTTPFAFNDLDTLDAALAAHPGEYAAVILEPAAVEEPAAGFLEGVRDRAHAAGALLVFDEVVTGFRLALGGAQERYGVVADLATCGKALANGMPLSAIIGSAAHMSIFDDVFFSTTHGGETLSLAAALATLEVLREDGAHEALWRRGERLMRAITESASRHGLADVVRVTGAAPRSVVQVGEPEPDRLVARTLLQQELAKRGVLFNGSNFICLAHTDDQIDEIAHAYDESFAVLAARWPDEIEGALEGPVLEPVFRRV
jgi:glutamate-1-semialdehyde 2,1-aminomutase/spore coat polysaccharide biosynthesis protein SpsF